MEINIGVNQPLDVSLPSYATCGYLYDIKQANSSGVVHIAELSEEKSSLKGVGASKPVKLRITGLKPGKISLKEIRPFNPDGDPGHVLDIVISKGMT